MKERYRFLEGLSYSEEVLDWYDSLIEYFYPHNIDDVTDFDNEDVHCYAYLISLNPNNEKLLSEEIDRLLSREDAYFASIEISREKPLALLEYWKYPKEGRGQILERSVEGFLSEHRHIKKTFKKFSTALKLEAIDWKEMDLGLNKYFYSNSHN